MEYYNDYVNDYNIMFHTYLFDRKDKINFGVNQFNGSKGFRTQYSKCQMVIITIS